MTTQAQIDANRRNAQRSTGPRTAAGKAKAACNAIKHGLLAARIDIAEQDRDAFSDFRSQMLLELSPVGPTESFLADRIAVLSWRLRRADHIQSGVLDILTDDTLKQIESCPDKLPADRLDSDQARQEYILGRTAYRDFLNYKVIDRLAAYERRLERSLHASRQQFRRLQTLRTRRDETDSENEKISKRTQFRPAEKSLSDCELRTNNSKLRTAAGKNKPNSNPMHRSG